MEPHAVGTKFIHKYAGVEPRDNHLPSGYYTSVGDEGVIDDKNGTIYPWGGVESDKKYWTIIHPKEDGFDELYKRMTDGEA